MRFIRNKSEWMLNENLTQARRILRDNNIQETDKTFINLKKRLQNNIGYISWFTKIIFIEKIPYIEVSNILDIIDNDKYIIESIT